MVMRLRQQGLLGLYVVILALVQSQHSCVSGFVVVPTTLEQCSRVKQKQNHPEFSLSIQQELGRQVSSSSSSLSTSPESASMPSIHNKGEEENQTEDSSLWDALLDRFQGDFDNYAQVVDDRAQGLLPREGGGHEHIHCVLVPVNADSRLAAFYFDGVPGAIFRFRYYHLVPTDTADSGGYDPASSSSSSSLPLVDTVLYTLHPDLEKQLRQCPDPLEWPKLFHNFSPPPSSTSDSTDIADPKITLLEACDVRWSWKRDPIQHAYAAAVEHDNENSNDDGTNANSKSGIHAVMVHGSATVQSQMMPGQDILIKDQLSLWRDTFWIHDRGYDPETMAFIYGNQRGVPYRLQRVTKVNDVNADADVPEQDQQQKPKNRRVVVDPSLAWTLGPNYRTEKEYEEKMAVIGGPSSRKK
jgi:hypothetical protein